MGAGGTPGDRALAAAFRRTGLAVRDLWLRYLALGGNADEVSVEAQLYGLASFPPGEYNVLAQAVNEALDELPDAARTPRVAMVRAAAEALLRRRVR